MDYLFSDVPKGAIELKGSKSSYLEITNDGKLDAHKSITILANVYPTGSDGPIVAYDPMGKGVHLWQYEKTQLFVRFTTRGSNGNLTLEPLATRVLQVRVIPIQFFVCLLYTSPSPRDRG